MGKFKFITDQRWRCSERKTSNLSAKEGQKNRWLLCMSRLIKDCRYACTRTLLGVAQNQRPQVYGEKRARDEQVRCWEGRRCRVEAMFVPVGSEDKSAILATRPLHPFVHCTGIHWAFLWTRHNTRLSPGNVTSPQTRHFLSRASVSPFVQPGSAFLTPEQHFLTAPLLSFLLPSFSVLLPQYLPLVSTPQHGKSQDLWVLDQLPGADFK